MLSRSTANLSLFYRFSIPPFHLSFHLCVALYRRACLLSLWDLPWNVPFGVVSCAKRRELAASRCVTRVIVDLPLFKTFKPARAI